jgi:hypothetical protein
LVRGPPLGNWRAFLAQASLSPLPIATLPARLCSPAGLLVQGLEPIHGKRTAESATFARPQLKTSVPLDVRTHAKLCACAALRGVDRSSLAAKFVKAGLRDVLVLDSRRKAGQVCEEGRPEEEGEAREDDEIAA